MKNELEILRSQKNYLAQTYGVEEIAIFGSVARGDDTPNSDVDILVKLNTKTLSNYFSLLDYLKIALHRNVDLVTKNKHLSERFLYIINKDIIYV